MRLQMKKGSDRCWECGVRLSLLRRWWLCLTGGGLLADRYCAGCVARWIGKGIKKDDVERPD